MGINIWPGYKPHMQLKDSGLFLQIKPEYEVIRTTQSVLDELNFIKEVNENRGLDYKQEIRDYIVG